MHRVLHTLAYLPFARPLLYLFQTQHTFPTFHNLHPPVLIQTSSPGLQNRRRHHRVRQRRQAPPIQLVQCDLSFIQIRDPVNKFLETDVSVAALAVEVAFLVRCVLHVERVVPGEVSLGGGRVRGDVVAALGLVDADFALGCHIYRKKSVLGLLVTSF
jgi:hypothetical protein